MVLTHTLVDLKPPMTWKELRVSHRIRDPEIALVHLTYSSIYHEGSGTITSTEKYQLDPPLSV